MIAQFVEVSGTPVYINPAYVVTLRPDPEDPDQCQHREGQGWAVDSRSVVKHREVASKLVGAP